MTRRCSCDKTRCDPPPCRILCAVVCPLKFSNWLELKARFRRRTTLLSYAASERSTRARTASPQCRNKKSRALLKSRLQIRWIRFINGNLLNLGHNAPSARKTPLNLGGPSSGALGLLVCGRFLGDASAPLFVCSSKFFVLLRVSTKLTAIEFLHDSKKISTQRGAAAALTSEKNCAFTHRPPNRRLSKLVNAAGEISQKRMPMTLSVVRMKTPACFSARQISRVGLTIDCSINRLELRKAYKKSIYNKIYITPFFCIIQQNMYLCPWTQNTLLLRHLMSKSGDIQDKQTGAAAAGVVDSLHLPISSWVLIHALDRCGSVLLDSLHRIFRIGRPVGCLAPPPLPREGDRISPPPLRTRPRGCRLLHPGLQGSARRESRRLDNTAKPHRRTHSQGKTNQKCNISEWSTRPSQTYTLGLQRPTYCKQNYSSSAFTKGFFDFILLRRFSGGCGSSSLNDDAASLISLPGHQGRNNSLFFSTTFSLLPAHFLEHFFCEALLLSSSAFCALLSNGRSDGSCGSARAEHGGRQLLPPKVCLVTLNKLGYRNGVFHVLHVMQPLTDTASEGAGTAGIARWASLSRSRSTANKENEYQHRHYASRFISKRNQRKEERGTRRENGREREKLLVYIRHSLRVPSEETTDLLAVSFALLVYDAPSRVPRTHHSYSVSRDLKDEAITWSSLNHERRKASQHIHYEPQIFLRILNFNI
eukprot:284816944_1